MLSNKKMLTNTTASPARVAGTKRKIREADDFTATEKKAKKAKEADEGEEEADVLGDDFFSDEILLQLSRLSITEART